MAEMAKLAFGREVGFSLSHFSEILKTRDAAGKPYILIGGQAVNYWAAWRTGK